MGKEAVKIVIADAQFLTRAGLRALLSEQRQLRVVGEATDREELAQVLAATTPHVLMLDPQAQDHFSGEDISWLQRDYPALQLMLVTDESDREKIHRLLSQGVGCILTKHCGPEEIVSAVLATHRGEKFYCNKVLDIILEKPALPEEASCRPSSLSAREAEIVTLVAQGITTKDIADRLCLSLHTVYTHRKNIMKKLEINSVSEMILYAMQTGLVQQPT